jgi:diguanylate cyclase (GGDEF)-like protein
MASDVPSPREPLRAALLDLGWWLAGAAVGLLLAISLRDAPLSAPGSAWPAAFLLLVLLVSASATAIGALRGGLIARDVVALLQTAGWATIAGGAAAGLAGLAGLAGDRMSATLPSLTGAIAGAWIGGGLLLEARPPLRYPRTRRTRIAAIALLFVAVEIGLAVMLFAAGPPAGFRALLSLAVAGGMIAAAFANVTASERVSRTASAAVIAAAGVATLGVAPPATLVPLVALALFAVASLAALRPARHRETSTGTASAAERRIVELGRTLPGGLFLVDSDLDVVAIGTGRRTAAAPLELTFVDRRSPEGWPRLEGIVREIDARSGDGDETARLTRELHAAMSELLESRRTVELQRAEIDRSSRADALTGLPNRGAILARLEQEVAQARRYQHGVAVLVVDIDGFGAINREHGIERADAALRELALRLRLRSREADALGRLSGDSFLAILPHTDERGVMSFGDALCRRVAGHPLVDGGRPLLATVSAGAAVMTPGDDESADALVARAEAALANAVRNGGDQVAFDGLRRLPRASSGGQPEIGPRAADGTR